MFKINKKKGILDSRNHDAIAAMFFTDQQYKLFHMASKDVRVGTFYKVIHILRAHSLAK